VGKPVYSEGKVHVMAEKCDTCIFRPGNQMRLNPGRVKEMVTASIEGGGGITCHKTIHGQAEQEATCRGFFDACKDQVPAFDLAERIGVIEEVSLDGIPE
jgi:hypothetical protein